MLTSRLGSFEGLHVLDLFAGSGALGLEALSRGAAYCTFVEQDRVAFEALQKNISKLAGNSPIYNILPQSVLSLGKAPKAYDLILMDPPYATGAGAVALDKLARLGWISPSSWISIETGRREDIQVTGFEIDKRRDIGKARITLLRPVSPS